MRHMIDMSSDKEILGHWLWALPILLIVAVLSIRQIDLYPPTTDELHSSMNEVGWLTDHPYSPIDVIAQIHRISPEHFPGYFILLNLWGKFTPHDLAIGRVLGVYFGLLSLSFVYRLGKDFVAPAAGLFAAVIVASCAFHNFYLAHLRMYSLLVLTSGPVLWLYLRIVHQLSRVRIRDYLALWLAVIAMVSAQVFSLLLLFAVGIHHLLFVPKDSKWWRVSAAIAGALLIFLPNVPNLISQGVTRTLDLWGGAAAGAEQAIRLWLTVASNNQVGLVLLSLAGLALGVRKEKFTLQPYLLLPFTFLVTLALFAELTGLVSKYGMRYQLAGWFPFVLLMVAGLYSLYRLRRWLGLLVSLWVIAGLSFQATADWSRFLSTGRATPFSLPAYHAISRLALQDGQRPHIVGLPYHPRHLDHGYSNFTNREFYFSQHGIHLEFLNTVNPDALENHLRQNARFDGLFWLFYQTSKVDASEISALDSVVKDLHYRLCDTVAFGIDTVVRRYSWLTLDCETPQAQFTSANRHIVYQFYGTALEVEEARLYFSDKWAAEDIVALDDYWMSYQLISPEWDNVAQLDLPLVNPEDLRIFYIDFSKVPAGSYRLMAILYERATGDRIRWLENDGSAPEMLLLSEVQIS